MKLADRLCLCLFHISLAVNVVLACTSFASVSFTSSVSFFFSSSLKLTFSGIAVLFIKTPFFCFLNNRLSGSAWRQACSFERFVLSRLGTNAQLLMPQRYGVVTLI